MSHTYRINKKTFDYIQRSKESCKMCKVFIENSEKISENHYDIKNVETEEAQRHIERVANMVAMVHPK